MSASRLQDEDNQPVRDGIGQYVDSSWSVLVHAVLKHAGRGNNAAIRVRNNRSPRIEDCVITESSYRGVRAEDGSHAVVTGCNVYNHCDVGIWGRAPGSASASLAT